jgi:hypothetical protein
MQGIATFGHVVGVLHTGKFKGKLTLSFSQKVGTAPRSR